MIISFRIVETLGSNNMIIGLSDVRKYDLTTIFKHMYKYATEEVQRQKSKNITNDPTTDPSYDQCDVSVTSRTPVSPSERRSPTNVLGADARVLAQAEPDPQLVAKLQAPKLSLIEG